MIDSEHNLLLFSCPARSISLSGEERDSETAQFGGIGGHLGQSRPRDSRHEQEGDPLLVLPLARAPCRACPGLLLHTRCWHLGVCSCSCISKPSERSRNRSRTQLIDRKSKFWPTGGTARPKVPGGCCQSSVPTECTVAIGSLTLASGHWPPRQSQGLACRATKSWLSPASHCCWHVLLSNLPELSAGWHLLICCLLLLS